jgi:DNA-binding PadR family transcriptional regulator
MAQNSLTTFEYALLGLIGMSPMAGYDLHKAFETTPLGHFSSSPGAIYPALRRLAGRGLLDSRLDSTTEARPRRVYALTEAGEEALGAWLHQPVTREELIRGGGAPILRFALAEGRLSSGESVAYLASYREAVESYLEELRQHEAQMPAHPLHGRLALQQGIRALESEVEWTKWAANRIRRAARSPRTRRAPR